MPYTTTTALDVRARIDATIAGLERAVDGNRLQNWRDHWWGEIMCDVDMIMATLAPDPIYRTYGMGQRSPGSEINTTEEARSMYSRVIGFGISPGGLLEDERWAFGDWGLTLECQHTIVFPGSMLAYADPTLDPDGLYLMTNRMSTQHPYDASGLMKGEIVYFADPISIERTDRHTLDQFLGRVEHADAHTAGS